jgi:undecaprenyl-diphosphatase
MTTLESIIIAVVEGLTEFLPISSTGHMIIAEKLLAIPPTEFTKVFTVAIQLGAILAVVVLYWKKFFDFKNWQFYLKLIAGVIPALVFGFLFSKKIDLLLESALTVAISLLLGGIILLFIEKLFKDSLIHSEKEVGFKQATIIGFWQCIAMIPGVSRSAASIIGGMQQKLTRNAAAEFSFFLAVPTMLAATGYKLLKFFKETASKLTYAVCGRLYSNVSLSLIRKYLVIQSCNLWKQVLILYSIHKYRETAHRFEVRYCIDCCPHLQ